MELRFLEGNWEHGKFKLQYKEGVTHDAPWIDVPSVKEEQGWCEHIKLSGNNNQAVWMFYPINNFAENDPVQRVSPDWELCPVCGTRRPVV